MTKAICVYGSNLGPMGTAVIKRQACLINPGVKAAHSKTLVPLDHAVSNVAKTFMTLQDFISTVFFCL